MNNPQDIAALLAHLAQMELDAALPEPCERTADCKRAGGCAECFAEVLRQGKRHME